MEIKRYFSALKGLDINYHRVIHGIKTALACLIGLAIERYYQWPMGQWVPITIMVVMSAQTHFGGAVQKAIMRFLGTVVGVATVVAVLWLFGDNVVVIFCTIFLASIFFAYIASSHGDISYAGNLGGVTVILILAGQQISIETAIQRGFYIVLGIVIALLVSRFVFPIHARDRLRYHVAITLRNLSKLYLAVIQLNPESDQKIEGISSKIAADIAAQPRLIHEAVVGSRVFAAKKGVFGAIIGSEHSLNRFINLMYLSLHEAASPMLIKQQLEAVAMLHDTICNGLDDLANCFESAVEPKEVVNLHDALAIITQVVAGLPKEEDPHQIIVEHSFLFFMEQILKELENMRKLIAKVNGKNGGNVI